MWWTINLTDNIVRFCGYEAQVFFSEEGTLCCIDIYDSEGEMVVSSSSH